MKMELVAVIAAIRAQPWAIQPEYLMAIEALAARAMESDILKMLADDGHAARIAASQSAMSAVAAVGSPLAGAAMSTVRDGVAVVPVLGAIYPRSNMAVASAGGTSLDAVMRDFRVAQASEDVERIVLLIDSPGGVVSGVGEAAAAIRASAKPVTAYVTGIGASLAYWLASQATEVVLDRAAYVGSIGVLQTVQRQVAPDANGMQSYEIASSNAPFKRPDVTTDEGRASVQQGIDAAEAVFIGDVAAGRKVSADKVKSDFGKGGMLTAEDAVRAGMADRIGTLEGVLSQGSGRTRIKPPAGRRALMAADIETRRRAADRS